MFLRACPRENQAGYDTAGFLARGHALKTSVDDATKTF